MYIVVVNPLMRNLRFVNPSTLFGDKINQSNSCFEQELRKNNTNYKIRFSNVHAQDKLGEFETYTSGALLADFVIDYSHDVLNIIIQIDNVFDKIHYNHLSRIKDIAPEPGRSIQMTFKLFL